MAKIGSKLNGKIVEDVKLLQHSQFVSIINDINTWLNKGYIINTFSAREAGLWKWIEMVRLGEGVKPEEPVSAENNSEEPKEFVKTELEDTPKKVGRAKKGE